MTPTTPLPAAELAARKAAIAKQQADDLDAAVEVDAALDAAVEVDAALHQLADRLHNAAFAQGTTPPPSFADSLTAAARELLAQAAKNPAFPAAALARLRLYAPQTPTAPEPTPAEAIAAAEQAAEAA